MPGNENGDAASQSAGELLRLTDAIERLGALDAREAAHYQDILSQLNGIADSVAAVAASTGAMAGTIASQAAVLASLDGIDQRVADLARLYSEAGESREDEKGLAYKPGPPLPWWKLTIYPALKADVLSLADSQALSDDEPGTAAELARGIRRLRDWVSRVYEPGYGHLAVGLSRCWDQHPLCLYTLDWLHELWSVLYLSQRRTPATLAGMAEFQTRLLPAAAAQMQAETATCTMHSAPSADHAQGRPLLRAPAP